MLLTSNFNDSRYIILFVVTIVALSILPTYDIQFHFGHLMTKINKFVKDDLFSSGRKEKNEDENCEYDMMWDAEGGLHLIKKHSKAPLVVSKEMSSAERLVDHSTFISLTFVTFLLAFRSFYVLVLDLSTGRVVKKLSGSGWFDWSLSSSGLKMFVQNP